MTHEPMASIIIPTKNRSGMLKNALESVLAQGYKDWETIIVANGCTDDTAQVVGKYLSDPRFKFIDIKESTGGARARNIGIDSARGDYIAFLDDDDEWLPDKLSEQMAAMNSSKAQIVGCWYDIYRDGAFFGTVRQERSVDLWDLLFENVIGSFSSCMTKRDYIDGLRIDERLRACQDWDLWVKILHSTKGRAIIIQKPLLKYNEHSSPRLTTAHKRVAEARSLFIKSHWGKMTARHRKYHVLAKQILFSEKTKHGLAGRLERSAVFLTVSRKRKSYVLYKKSAVFLSVSRKRKTHVLYKTFFEYLLGIRSKKLRGALNALVDSAKYLMGTN